MSTAHKNTWKILLDAVLVVLLALMYNKRALGMTFHEVGGLALCGLFLVHKLLNWPWIKAVTRKLFSRKTPARQRLFWILDLLLFLSFGYVLVSGILISKVVFPSAGGGASFKMGHYAAAALALALTGVHLGLHLKQIGQRMHFLAKLPLLARRGLAVALSLSLLVLGGVQLTSTSYVRWLSNLGAVVGLAEASPEGAGQEHRIADLGAALAEGTASDETGTGATAVVQSVTDDTSAAQAATADGSTAQAATADGTSEQVGTDAISTGQTVTADTGAGGGGETSNNVGAVLASFLSLLLAFTVIAGWADGLLAARKRKRLLRQALRRLPA